MALGAASCADVAGPPNPGFDEPPPANAAAVHAATIVTLTVHAPLGDGVPLGVTTVPLGETLGVAAAEPDGVLAALGLAVAVAAPEREPDIVTLGDGAGVPAADGLGVAAALPLGVAAGVTLFVAVNDGVAVGDGEHAGFGTSDPVADQLPALPHDE